MGFCFSFCTVRPNPLAAHDSKPITLRRCIFVTDQSLHRYGSHVPSLNRRDICEEETTTKTKTKLNATTVYKDVNM